METLHLMLYSERGSAETCSSEQYLRHTCGFIGCWRQSDYLLMYPHGRHIWTLVVRWSWYSDGRRSSLRHQRRKSQLWSVSFDEQLLRI